ncbi:MAG: hypoxanthine phosphoribosyltransferase [Clostridia bacterium]|nr:hypoxanthine phosphoribosyltransferase [Clostridia bacterium]
MYGDIEKVLISEEELKKKTKELGEKITKDYTGKNLLIISVLKGGFVFTSDLMRAIKISAPVEFMAVSSYGSSTKSSGVVEIRKDLDRDIKGMDVLIVEDVLDSGLTLSYLSKLLRTRGAKSIKICTILNKPQCRKADVEADYIGFNIGDDFVVGYGLDFNENYRNLPFVGVLKSEVYENKV